MAEARGRWDVCSSLARVQGAREVGDIVTCWMPIFEEYTPEVPIHLADEPESFLWSIATIG